MAKFRCICGETISTSGAIPNPNEWQCISDTEFHGLPDSTDLWELYREMKVIYRCPVSDHIWAFWDGLENAPSLYTPTAIDDPEDG